MARTAKGKKNLIIQIDESLFDFIDELHWSKRKDTKVMVAEVILAWAASEGYKVPKTQD